MRPDMTDIYVLTISILGMLILLMALARRIRSLERRLMLLEGHKWDWRKELK